MEFKTKNKEHQFLEVDQDLRRIAEKEASRPLCPFGKNCYRRNPNHLQEYRHPSHSSPSKKTDNNDKNVNKRCKITDFFGKKPSTLKKLPIESSEAKSDDKDNEIEDSEEEVNFKTVVIKDKPNTSICSEKTPKQKELSSLKTKSNTKTESSSKKRLKFANNESDVHFGDQLNSFLSEDISPSKLKPKQIKRNTYSPNVRKLDVFEDINPKNQKTTNKLNQSSEEIKSILKKPKESLEEKTSIDVQLKPKMSSEDWNVIIKEIFLFSMPKDFFQLWQFCKTIKRESPEDALVDTLGLRLVGPYDLLSGKLNRDDINDKEQILCHCRYFYDLPEFQTTIASNKSGYHLGYFRDTPEEEHPVVVANNSDKSCVIEGVADNICAAVYAEIQKQKYNETSSNGLKQLESKLKGFCEVNKIDLKAVSRLKSRKSKINAKTFNNFGFVVPFDKKTEVGYRPLPLADSQLKKLLNTILKVDSESRSDCKSLMDLQEIIQLISYANDECDFGMGLELGIDLFCSGDPFFHKSALHLLTMAYDLLKREAFSRIIKAHLKDRPKKCKLNLFCK